jgi:hypothetical protein
MKKWYFKFFLLILCVSLESSCKKLVEDKKRDLLVEAMTKGSWHVETFQEGPAPITNEFTGYNFQFHSNGAVEGITDSLVSEGTWTSDVQNYSITSNFPLATGPLKKLNGTWKITDTKADYVAAEMNNAQVKNLLHLRKNP